MLYFALSVFFTVALYLIMRAYPRFQVNSFHAVVFNYYSCVATGLLLTPDWTVFRGITWTSEGILFTLALGAMFVVTFMLIGLSAQKVSVTAASLAGNMSLVIPVLFGLFVFKNNNKEFTVLNYTGLVLALVALALGAIQKRLPETRQEPGNAERVHALWIFPVLSFFASGTNNTLINYLSAEYYQPGQTTVFMIIACLGAVLIGTSVLAFRLSGSSESLRLQSVLGGMLLGIPNFLSLYFLLLALASFGNSAAYVFPIYNILTMLVSAFAAWIFYKERLSAINQIGLAIAVVAILLISYQELNF